MVAGTWFNQDGLYLQFGTQKPVPEVGGDYMVYGDVREIEQYIPLVPMQFSTSGLQVPAPATSFSGTSTAAAAGIVSLTTFFPLAQTAPTTAASSSVITVSQPQIFIEQVEVDTIMAATQSGVTTGSISVGLVTSENAAQAASANGAFVQITSSVGSAGQQILNAFPLVASGSVTAQGGVGAKTVYTGPTNGFTFSGAGSATVAAGGGSWVGIFSPIPTNSLTPLPQSAWLSTIVTTNAGSFTSGLLKLRIKYVMFGNINY
jgi:hypothetical protein